MALEQLGPAPQHADAGRAHHLVGREGEEVDAERRATSTGACGTSCAPSATTTAPASCAASAMTRTGLMVPSTLDMHDTPTSLTPSTRRSRSSRTRRPSPSIGDVAQVEAAQLLGEDHPGHDVGVVLHLGEQHGVARPQVGPAPGVGHQVERLGRVLGEDDLVRRVRRADEAARRPRGPARRARSPPRRWRRRRGARWRASSRSSGSWRR